MSFQRSWNMQEFYAQDTLSPALLSSTGAVAHTRVPSGGVAQSIVRETAEP
jgi:hypothetical protein